MTRFGTRVGDRGGVMTALSWEIRRRGRCHATHSRYGPGASRTQDQHQRRRCATGEEAPGVEERRGESGDDLVLRSARSRRWGARFELADRGVIVRLRHKRGLTATRPSSTGASRRSTCPTVGRRRQRPISRSRATGQSTGRRSRRRSIPLSPGQPSTRPAAPGHR